MAQARLTDVGLFLARALQASAATLLRRGVGRRRRPSWGLRHELMVSATRATWALMPKIGMVRWRNVGEQLSPEASGGVETRPLEHASLEGTWFEPAGTPDPTEGPVLLYLHGGGFVFGSMKTHGNLVGHLAKACGARALGIEYRLAPEHPFPAAIEDCCSAYRALLDSGLPAERIVIAGDSAGGNLVLTTLLALREAGDPLPAAGVPISPWVDLSNSGESFQTHDDIDFVRKRYCDIAAADYLRDRDLRDPAASPLYADLRDLPPLLVHVGALETLVDQVRAFVGRAREQGVEVEFEVYEEMVHVWHLYVGMVPAAQQAIDEIAAFFRRHVEG